MPGNSVLLTSSANLEEAILESRETILTTGWKPSAVALLIAATQFTGAFAVEPALFTSIRADFGHYSATNFQYSFVPTLSAIERDLFSAISEVYDRLLKNSKDLDSGSHRVLYQRRWELYQ